MSLFLKSTTAINSSFQLSLELSVYTIICNFINYFIALYTILNIFYTPLHENHQKLDKEKRKSLMNLSILLQENKMFLLRIEILGN